MAAGAAAAAPSALGAVEQHFLTKVVHVVAALAFKHTADSTRKLSGASSSHARYLGPAASEPWLEH
jgi:hypothetical protein